MLFLVIMQLNRFDKQSGWFIELYRVWDETNSKQNWVQIHFKTVFRNEWKVYQAIHVHVVRNQNQFVWNKTFWKAMWALVFIAPTYKSMKQKYGLLECFLLKHLKRAYIHRISMLLWGSVHTHAHTYILHNSIGNSRNLFWKGNSTSEKTIVCWNWKSKRFTPISTITTK